MMDKNLLALEQKILQLTSEIEDKFPELYAKLDENPFTVPNEEHPDLPKEMQEYYEYLQAELETYKKLHRNNG